MKRNFLGVLLFVCVACSNTPQATQPTALRPTPTIAAAIAGPTLAPLPSPTPQLSIQPAAPVAPTASSPEQAVQPTQATVPVFRYLWPAYLPDGLRVSPNESRVARENEIGTTSGGFYLVTLNGDNRKLVIGGGSTDALPLVGDTREVTYDSGTALLTTSGEQMQLVFVRDGAKFFVYSRGISEPDMLLVAESMVPLDVASLRALAAGGQ